ncbi:bone marrow proteoglycan isoform X1 [Psammomys obesus]|uniref:bone marrow proteoglycan isoform X1 n=1 Tax=Psammomys obesus TaxID=48139 RepID=UPI0024536B6D|nr:bone marrow proteoglycan isoform X1 [Psammomys obesus]
MKFPLLLALLVGGVSALHLRSEASDSKSPLTDENLPRDAEMPRAEVEEYSPGEELMPLEEEEGSGSKSAPGDEGAVSGQDAMDGDLQCPKEEDTMSLTGVSGCKTCRYVLVQSAERFDKAQSVCRRCYRGSLASIHSFHVNFRIQCSVRRINQGQVWIGGRIVGWGRCTRFQWVDGSSWNFAYWASGQPGRGGGRCVALCTQGGHWRRSHCAERRPFICSF